MLYFVAIMAMILLDMSHISGQVHTKFGDTAVVKNHVGLVFWRIFDPVELEKETFAGLHQWLSPGVSHFCEHVD